MQTIVNSNGAKQPAKSLLLGQQIEASQNTVKYNNKQLENENQKTGKWNAFIIKFNSVMQDNFQQIYVTNSGRNANERERKNI